MGRPKNKVLSGGRVDNGFNEFELGKPFSRKRKPLGIIPIGEQREAKAARKVLSFFTNRANKSLMEALMDYLMFPQDYNFRHLLSELARFELFYGKDITQPEAGKIADEFATQGELFLSQLCAGRDEEKK